ncbi:MAG: Ger(x)C family spore germination protein [Alicyclobacillus sp.]|nr:Ger(x)C family spore germination protein [Alicyclobacillus sp.]
MPRRDRLRAGWRVKLRVLGALLLSLPLVTGCWDRLEIEMRATVLGLAIDLADSAAGGETNTSQGGSGPSRGASDPDTDDTRLDATASSGIQGPIRQHALRLTAQIAVPGRIPLGPGGGGGGSSGSSDPSQAVWVLHAEGLTLDEALQNLQQQVADRLFYGHLRIIVVSEALAREYGLQKTTDFLLRNPQVRRTVWLVVARANAAQLMETAPPLERVPALYLMATMDHAVQMGKFPNEFFGIFASKAVMKGREPVLPYVEVMQRDNVRISGLALFHGERMVATTARTFDITSYMQLQGVGPGGYSIMVPVPGQHGTVMWQAFRRKSKIQVRLQDGVPHFTVRIRLEGNIREKSQSGIQLNDPRVLAAIEQQVEREGREGLQEFIQRTQQLKIDPVGFGEYVRARQPRYWDAHVHTRDEWETLYQRATFDIQMQVKTDRIGMENV